jgi:hypothetical protein
VTPTPHALAVINGAFCQVTRNGNRTRWHAPLATAVVEFHHGAMNYYVREHPYGLLPGLPNLYCLDASLRLKWMAEWPDSGDPCTSILGETDNALVAVSAAGLVVSLDTHSGRLLACSEPVAMAVS